MRPRRLSAFLALLILLGGCGLMSEKEPPPAEKSVAKPSPKQLLARMQRTLAKAESLTYEGTVKVGKDTGEVNSSGDVDAKYAEGYVSIPGGSVHYRVVGARVYVTGGDDLAAMLAGGRPPGDQWALVDGTPLGLDLREVTAGAIWKQLRHGPPPRPAAHAEVTEALSADGHPAFLLMCVEWGSRKPFRVTVSADGSWRLLQIGRPADRGGYLQFSDWNKVERVKAPAKADLVR